jgi:heme A synthase
MLTQGIIGTTVNVAAERPRSSVAKVNLTPATISKTGSVSVGPFAWFVVAYNIAVILWGAYVRVSGSGAGCGSRWPLCNGEILPSGTQSQTLIEFVHRVTGVTGSLASLGDTILPVGSLRHALLQDFSSSSHVLLRLRLLHPVAAVIGSLYVLWLLWNLQGKRDWLASRLVLGATLTAQIVLGLMNVILLAPVWLQMTHLLVAELFWILLVLASAGLLLVEQQWSGLVRERTSEVTWGALKHMPRIRSSFMKISEDDQKETLKAI